MKGLHTPREAWHMLATASAINFVNAGFPPYVGSALGPFMATDLGLDRRAYGLIFSSFLLMTGLLGPVVALAIGRWGVRRTLAAGSLLICAGSLTMAFVVDGAGGAILSYGVLVGGGAGTGGMLASQTIVTRWFVERRALALSLVIAAMALGGVAATPIVSWLALDPSIGWRGGWVLLAILSAATSIVALTRVREWPGETSRSMAATGAPKSSAMEGEWTLGRALRSAAIWPVFAGAVGMSCTMSFVMAHGPVHLRDIGFSAVAASGWLSLLTVGQLAGTLGAGVLGDRISPRLVWVAGLIVLGLGLVLVRYPASEPVLLLSGVLLGLGIGGSMTGVMSIPAKYYGPHVYPALIGIITPLLTITGASTSYLAGIAFDLTGSYALAFDATIALIAASAALLLTVRPPGTPIKSKAD